MVHRRVHDNASIEDGDSCTNNSLLDVYANRQQYDSSPEIMNMHFVQFATTYKVVNLQNYQRTLFQEYFQHTPLILKVQILVFIVNISF